MLDIPVLFIIYNRLREARKVFQAISESKPAKLYIAADGPVKDDEEDAERCNKVRGLVSSIDWKCEVYEDFSDHNLGFKNRIITALDWIFSREEEAIILEDDCLPNTDFFQYCSALLEEYKEDERIMLISGNNPLGKWKDDKLSYFFSYQGEIWGWATWKRAWEKYDVRMKEWNNKRTKKIIKDRINNEGFYNIRKKTFDNIVRGIINAWDYQWFFARLLHDGLSIVPSVNLVSNIGFSGQATHTDDPSDNRAYARTYRLKLPLKGPDTVEDDTDFAEERYLQLMGRRKKSILLKIKEIADRVAGRK